MQRNEHITDDPEVDLTKLELEAVPEPTENEFNTRKMTRESVLNDEDEPGVWEDDGGEELKEEKPEKKSFVDVVKGFAKSLTTSKKVSAESDPEKDGAKVLQATINKRSNFISPNSVWMTIVAVLVIIIIALSAALASANSNSGDGKDDASSSSDFPPLFTDEFLFTVDDRTLFGFTKEGTEEFVIRTDPEFPNDAINFIFACTNVPVSCFMIGFRSGKAQVLNEGCIETCEQGDQLVLSTPGGDPLQIAGVSFTGDESGVASIAFQFDNGETEIDNDFIIIGQLNDDNSLVDDTLNGASVLRGIFGHLDQGILIDVGLIFAPVN